MNLAFASKETKAARGRGRAGAIIGLSLLAHILVLGLIGFSAPKLRFLELSEAPALNVWLTPDLARKAAAPKESRLAPLPRIAAPSAAQASQATATPSVPQAVRLTTPSLTPAPPAPSGAATGSPAPLGDEVGAGVRAALRGRLGCDVQGVARLTAEERARCDQHMAETAKLGPAYVDPVPAEKRAYYDAVQAAYQASRHPEEPYYRDANGNIQTWGHPPAVGCTFRRKFKPGASMTDKIKATGMIGVPLGPLSCGLALPQGSMTPEIGIPTP